MIMRVEKGPRKRRWADGSATLLGAARMQDANECFAYTRANYSATIGHVPRHVTTPDRATRLDGKTFDRDKTTSCLSRLEGKDSLTETRCPSVPFPVCLLGLAKSRARGGWSLRSGMRPVCMSVAGVRGGTKKASEPVLWRFCLSVCLSFFLAFSLFVFLSFLVFLPLPLRVAACVDRLSDFCLLIVCLFAVFLCHSASSCA